MANSQRTRCHQWPVEKEVGPEAAVLPARRRARLLHPTLKRPPHHCIDAGRQFRPAFLVMAEHARSPGVGAPIRHLTLRVCISLQSIDPSILGCWDRMLDLAR